MNIKAPVGYDVRASAGIREKAQRIGSRKMTRICLSIALYIIFALGWVFKPDLSAGNLFLTGHDVLHHEGQNGYDAVILDYLRDGKPKSEYHLGVIGTAGNGSASFTDSTQNVAGLNHQDPINLDGILSGYASATFYDAEELAADAVRRSILNSLNAIIVLSHETAVNTSLTHAGVEAMIAMGDCIIFAFNRGTDIWANSGASTWSGYYDFLGVPIGHAQLPGFDWNPPFSDFVATYEGGVIGIQNSMINGFPTHNRFFSSQFPEFTIFEENLEGWIISIGIKDARFPRRVPISAGSGHSLALKEDGTVWAWGSNGQGALGDNFASGSSGSNTPIEVLGIEDVVAVVAEGNHSLALKTDGTVWAWGSNSFGQIGDGTTLNRYVPVQVSGLTEVVAIDAGPEHSLALRIDGTVWAWGGNQYGQLGDGTTSNSSVPVQVSYLDDIVDIAVGNQHNLAIDGSGNVQSWGRNHFGALGRSLGRFGSSYETTPGLVQGLSGVTATSVEGGWGFSLALTTDGKVYAWGRNNSGQLGINSTSDTGNPTQALIEDVVRISAGTAHCLAVDVDGVVWSWGRHLYGELGFPSTEQWSSVPVSLIMDYLYMTPETIHSISAGGIHSFAMDADYLKAWGGNIVGQIGDGTFSNSTVPVPVVGF